MRNPWRNLGTTSRRWLAEAGIVEPGQLAELGAVRAWLRVKARQPAVSLNLLWAMQGALCDLSWQQVAREQRLSLLLALEDAQKNGAPDAD
ncbi:TfoX/Sxy family protein [uncultured Aquitalea sp.]|uniref:TfoX/Sxy family protein n=1 Tax=uncultured Aquitalea sp. TaxID=540272 RepID=UPI0025F583C1|nr:TfoX/Sxy family protein [uncultured Aquitalea sp.]